MLILAVTGPLSSHLQSISRGCLF
uniref:Uncharacterized protein n=1 Tax=Rhizophora mucronata TaxID=61149 RepID=A0A2P2NXR7_RHIMU